jgi:hypothetical protein
VLDQNLDINLVIQVFQEKVTQLTMDNIVKEATIKQLVAQIDGLVNSQQDIKDTKKDK